MRFLFLLCAALLTLPSCDELFDDRPAYYVEGLAQDIFLSIPLNIPGGEPVTAEVVLRTAVPLSQPVPGGSGPIRLISFNAEGDNIYENTLADSVIEAPSDEGDQLWTWSGNVPLPLPDFPGGAGAARRVGVEIPPGLVVEALRAPAVAGEFCRVDILGPGVQTCGPWIEALLGNLVRCRGSIKEFVDCHGLNYVILPFVLVRGIARPSAPEAGMTAKNATILFTSHLYLYLAPDGWRYKALIPLDFYQPTFPSLDGRTSYGPFADAAEAARDAARTLKLPRGSWYAGLVDMCEPGSDLARAAATLTELLHSSQWDPPTLDNGSVKEP